MVYQKDLSFLDQPEILQFAFPVALSSYYGLENLPCSPSKATDIHYVEVESGIRIGCGFWVKGKEYPSILYFHGNGETIGTYDEVALLYNEIGVNFFVADYRGYGLSNGMPTITNMISDAHPIFKAFKKIIKRRNFKKSIFIMGRSLGSIPAIELAFHHQNDISGLIIESGSADDFRHLWEHLKDSEKEILLNEENCLLNEMKIRRVKKPTFIIHGQKDSIVCAAEGKELFKNSGAKNKEILIIPDADHNTIIGADQYFPKIKKFVEDYG
ncbi:MAG: alpha/beta hydrolase [Deltaproteobacteria bacterium]|nr:alpha/beta hydrolase [Deltaproteobacteria bacterium]